MSDMTAGERAKQVLANYQFTDWEDDESNKEEKIQIIASAIHQAEAAARRKALGEAAQTIENFFDCSDFDCLDLLDEIRALMDNPDDSLVRSASVAKRHVKSWPKWKQGAMRREVGIKERDRKKWQ